MKKAFFCLLIFMFSAGCSKHQSAATSSLVESKSSLSNQSHSSLAYEHAISIEADEQNLPIILEAGQAACRDASGDACSILESRLSTGRTPFAFLKIRAQPNAIKKIVAALNKRGVITEQSTTAEDLAAPIADVAKKLAMLKDYRSNLENLRARASSDVDSLIKLSRELAQVQAELEAAQGSHAFLLQRVETEILKISVQASTHRAFWKPINLALSEFGDNFSQGISTAISGSAFLLPWIFLFLIVAWMIRKIWRHRKIPKTQS